MKQSNTTAYHAMQNAGRHLISRNGNPDPKLRIRRPRTTMVEIPIFLLRREVELSRTDNRPGFQFERDRFCAWLLSSTLPR